MDFKILKKDGYIELRGANGAVVAGRLNASELWAAVGQGQTGDAIALLNDAGLLDDYDEDIKSVRMISTPDDIFGNYFRVWVRQS
jgi:hypothetical protein